MFGALIYGLAEASAQVAAEVRGDSGEGRRARRPEFGPLKGSYAEVRYRIPAPSRRVVPLSPAQARDRSVRRQGRCRMGAAVLQHADLHTPGSLLHMPSIIGNGVAQAALPLAILVALTVNPKIRVRPNVFLCLVSLLVLDTVITAAEQQHLGTMYRTFRLAEFVVALWLLTPWWGRTTCCSSGVIFAASSWPSARCFSASSSPRVAPSPCRQALRGDLADGPTQVAQYAAVAAGLMVVLWLARLLSGRVTLAGVTVAVLSCCSRTRGPRWSAWWRASWSPA